MNFTGERFTLQECINYMQRCWKGRNWAGANGPLLRYPNCLPCTKDGVKSKGCFLMLY